jgi:isocitrate dehydrogenase
MTQETGLKSSEDAVQIGKEKRPLEEEIKIAKAPPENKSEKKKLKDDQELIQELQRQQTLRRSAWTAFRLLATQCISWTLSEDLQSMTLVDKNAISKLHDQIFDLMCEELKRLVEHAKLKTTQSCLKIMTSLDHSLQGTLSLLIAKSFFSLSK